MITTRRFASLLSIVGFVCWMDRPAAAAVSMDERVRSERNDLGYHPNALSRFQVEGLDDAVMQHIALRFDIEYREGARFSVLVPPWQHGELLSLAPGATLVDQEISEYLSSDRGYRGPPGYRQYDQVRESFEKWAEKYPNLVTLIDRPGMVSKNGRQFILAKLTRDVQKEHPNRPNIVITASTHGDEHLTTESLLLNVEKLVEGYETNPRFKKMLDRANIYIVPVVSPDSFLFTRRVHGVDPNRVYDFPGDPTPGTKLKSANEMIRFYEDIEPDGVLDFHGAPPKGMIMVPWGYAKHKEIEDPEDYELHHRVVKAMGKATPGYDAGTIWSTIYVAPGTTTDHNYMHHKMLAVVIEIGGGDKSPPISAIPGKAKEVEEATWIFIEALLPESDPEDESDESDESSKDSPDASDESSKDSPDESESPAPSPESKDSPEGSDSDDAPSKSEDSSDEDSGEGSSIPGCALSKGSSPLLLSVLGLAGFFVRRRKADEGA